ncbi:hypothetical protein [Arthrobacter psychrolactophilus]
MSNLQTAKKTSGSSKKMTILVIALIVALIAIIGGGGLLASNLGESSDVGAVETVVAGTSAPDPATAQDRELNRNPGAQ